MPRPRHSRRLNIKEGKWYTAAALVDAGWNVYCCTEVLVRYLRGYMDAANKNGITERRDPEKEHDWAMDPDDWEFSFKSRGKAKAILEDMKLVAAEEALDFPDEDADVNTQTFGRYGCNCKCEEAAYDREQKRKYGSR